MNIPQKVVLLAPACAINIHFFYSFFYDDFQRFMKICFILVWCMDKFTLINSLIRSRMRIKIP